MNRFHEKLVLITGASSGIGAESARLFAREGAHVLLLARREDALRSVAEGITGSGGQASYFAVDLTDHLAVEKVTGLIKEQAGIPDIIFNNAGGGLWRFIEETSDREAIDSISAPYLAAFFITRAFMPEMLKRDSGHIVNMTSFAGMIPFSGATAYIASRKAMIGFHEALTADLYRTNIRTSLSYFAKVASPYWEHNPESEKRLPKIQTLIPVVTTEKAAKVIVKGVANGRRRIRAPFMLPVIEFLYWLTPPITRFIMNRTGYQRGV